MNTISIDLETYSDVDIGKCGVYKYAESPNFEILLFAYSVDGIIGGSVDIAQGERIPDEIIRVLSDPTVTKWAFNAQFERICLSTYLHRYYTLDSKYLAPEGWKCSMTWCAYMGLPMSLAGAGAVLGLEQQKITEGKELIRYFCVPCKPTKANGGRTRNLPIHDKDKWDRFKKYNIRDVEVEMAIQERLQKFPVPDSVWEEFWLDQHINDRGIAVDMELAKNAICFDAQSREALMNEIKDITCLENPNSVMQLKDWLIEQGIEVTSLDKKAVSAMLPVAPPNVQKVLTIRKKLAKSSVKKYQAMENAVCSDGRARGMFRFYGANRTGRFAGRLIQLQNLPQNHISDLAEARSLVKAAHYEAMEMLYDDIPDTLSQLIRTAFIPMPGYKFIVADFSAIEARVLAYLAGEQWVLDTFAKGEDIYCATASRMFHCNVVKNGENGELRQKGKQATLSCIAEGSLVLTDKGLIRIENVTTDMLLWDGEMWVQHEGVVYKGEREVITYEGLTATPDHFVWVEGKQGPVHFGEAASCGAHLIQTGDGRRAIRLGENNKSRETVERKNESLLCINSMPGMRCRAVAGEIQSDCWQVKWVSAMLSAEKNSKMAGETINCCQITMRESDKSRVQKLWCERNCIWLFNGNTGGAVSNKTLWESGQKTGNRQDRLQHGICSWQYKNGYKSSKSCKSEKYCIKQFCPKILAILRKCCCSKAVCGFDKTRDYRAGKESGVGKTEKLENNKCKARLYDIQNAGPHHRFTVSGKLVHNCGYGGSVGALKAMGALESGMKEEELQPLVDAWRKANPNIVNFWWAVDRAVKEAVIQHTATATHGIKFICKSGMLFIELPSGRRLSYVKPRMGVNKFGSESVTYEGTNGTTKKWERLESYGPKFVENIVQGMSRDILMYAMRTLKEYRIVAHVHDEIIVECPEEVSVESICQLMGMTPPWAAGLQLKAEGYEGKFYKK